LVAVDVDAQSLRFTGTRDTNNDRVFIAIGQSQPANIGSTDFTIEMWLRPTTANTAPAVAPGYDYSAWAGNIFLDRDILGGNPRSFILSLTGGRVTLSIYTSSVETWRVGPDLRDSAWHHLAVTRSITTGVVQIFIDGIRVLNDSGPTGPLNFVSGGAANDPYIVLGGEKHFQGTPSYYGLIDEVRFSNAILYTADFARPSAALSVLPSTLALYHFDEGSGAVVTDAAGNRSPGTLGRSGTPPTPTWSTETPFSGAPSPGTVHLTSSTITGAESQSSVTFVLTRSGGTSGTATVDYATANGTATAGADYQTVMGTETWASGAGGDRAITIPLVQDVAAESNETFNVRISNATGAQLGTPSTATVTIADDDGTAPAAAGSIAFTATNYRVRESAGRARLVLRRSAGTAGSVSVSVTTSNMRARAPTDYTAVNQRIVTWPDGDATDKIVEIAIVNDTVYEYNERFSVAIASDSGASLGSPSTVTVTIVNDD
jgi:hypothetical protein